MCSRYSLISPSEAVRQLFDLKRVDDFPPRYNIAPTQPVLVVRRSSGGDREALLARWGLIPSWVKEPKSFSTLINARSETAAEKPSFRGAFRHRRCLIPADGYYEWTGSADAKQPHLIRLRSRETFAFAGLWENWLGADGSEIETVAILTTTANGDVSFISDRMPVILCREMYEVWLDCRTGTGPFSRSQFSPLPDGQLDAAPISRKLNNWRADGPELHAPATTGLPHG
ncbi:MAG: SOS response-associated peptidase [Hyphomicrobium sp.]